MASVLHVIISVVFLYAGNIIQDPRVSCDILKPSEENPDRDPNECKRSDVYNVNFGSPVYEMHWANVEFSPIKHTYYKYGKEWERVGGGKYNNFNSFTPRPKLKLDFNEFKRFVFIDAAGGISYITP